MRLSLAVKGLVWSGSSTMRDYCVNKGLVIVEAVILWRLDITNRRPLTASQILSDAIRLLTKDICLCLESSLLVSKIPLTDMPVNYSVYKSVFYFRNKKKGAKSE